MLRRQLYSAHDMAAVKKKQKQVVYFTVFRRASSLQGTPIEIMSYSHTPGGNIALAVWGPESNGVFTKLGFPTSGPRILDTLLTSLTFICSLCKWR